ncbi:MAG TPA: tryptophan-rich sensory protein [Allosphingosinicella sp.]|jgi:tryptophan-rich sensory protein|nr:tryptophan-rich sensory protein [Allosphingosinicella sp.]
MGAGGGERRLTYLLAFAICAAVALVEGLCAGSDPMAQLRATRQPRWSPPAWLWVLIGIVWYAICFTALVRLLPLWPNHKTAILLLCALMLANAGANILQFRMKRLDLAFFFLFPYWLLLAALMLATRSLDGATFALFGVYCLYQPYAAAWAYRLWRLNVPASGRA